jgi:dTDP-4-amino-4,6-dideoxygalactose transaminase
MYYVILSGEFDRGKVLEVFRRESIGAVFHYVPLHSSPGGQRHGRTHGSLEVTDRQSERLIRLPLWLGITAAQQERVVKTLRSAVQDANR